MLKCITIVLLVLNINAIQGNKTVEQRMRARLKEKQLTHHVQPRLSKSSPAIINQITKQPSNAKVPLHSKFNERIKRQLPSMDELGASGPEVKRPKRCHSRNLQAQNPITIARIAKRKAFIEKWIKKNINKVNALDHEFDEDLARELFDEIKNSDKNSPYQYNLLSSAEQNMPYKRSISSYTEPPKTSRVTRTTHPPHPGYPDEDAPDYLSSPNRRFDTLKEYLRFVRDQHKKAHESLQTRLRVPQHVMRSEIPAAINPQPFFDRTKKDWGGEGDITDHSMHYNFQGNQGFDHNPARHLKESAFEKNPGWQYPYDYNAGRRDHLGMHSSSVNEQQREAIPPSVQTDIQPHTVFQHPYNSPGYIFGNISLPNAGGVADWPDYYQSLPEGNYRQTPGQLPATNQHLEWTGSGRPPLHPEFGSLFNQYQQPPPIITPQSLPNLQNDGLVSKEPTPIIHISRATFPDYSTLASTGIHNSTQNSKSKTPLPLTQNDAHRATLETQDEAKYAHSTLTRLNHDASENKEKTHAEITGNSQSMILPTEIGANKIAERVLIHSAEAGQKPIAPVDSTSKIKYSPELTTHLEQQELHQPDHEGQPIISASQYLLQKSSNLQPVHREPNLSGHIVLSSPPETSHPALSISPINVQPMQLQQPMELKIENSYLEQTKQPVINSKDVEIKQEQIIPQSPEATGNNQLPLLTENHGPSGLHSFSSQPFHEQQISSRVVNDQEKANLHNFPTHNTQSLAVNPTIMLQPKHELPTQIENSRKFSESQEIPLNNNYGNHQQHFQTNNDAIQSINFNKNPVIKINENAGQTYQANNPKVLNGDSVNLQTHQEHAQQHHNSKTEHIDVHHLSPHTAESIIVNPKFTHSTHLNQEQVSVLNNIPETSQNQLEELKKGHDKAQMFNQAVSELKFSHDHVINELEKTADAKAVEFQQQHHILPGMNVYNGITTVLNHKQAHPSTLTQSEFTQEHAKVAEPSSKAQNALSHSSGDVIFPKSAQQDKRDDNQNKLGEYLTTGTWHQTEQGQLAESQVHKNPNSLTPLISMMPSNHPQSEKVPLTQTPEEWQKTLEHATNSPVNLKESMMRLQGNAGEITQRLNDSGGNQARYQQSHATQNIPQTHQEISNAQPQLTQHVFSHANPGHSEHVSTYQNQRNYERGNTDSLNLMHSVDTLKAQQQVLRSNIASSTGNDQHVQDQHRLPALPNDRVINNNNAIHDVRHTAETTKSTNIEHEREHYQTVNSRGQNFTQNMNERYYERMPQEKQTEQIHHMAPNPTNLRQKVNDFPTDKGTNYQLVPEERRTNSQAPASVQLPSLPVEVLEAYPTYRNKDQASNVQKVGQSLDESGNGQDTSHTSLQDAGNRRTEHSQLIGPKSTHDNTYPVPQIYTRERQLTRPLGWYSNKDQSPQTINPEHSYDELEQNHDERLSKPEADIKENLESPLHKLDKDYLFQDTGRRDSSSHTEQVNGDGMYNFQHYSKNPNKFRIQKGNVDYYDNQHLVPLKETYLRNFPEIRRHKELQPEKEIHVPTREKLSRHGAIELATLSPAYLEQLPPETPEDYGIHDSSYDGKTSEKSKLSVEENKTEKLDEPLRDQTQQSHEEEHPVNDLKESVSRVTPYHLVIEGSGEQNGSSILPLKHIEVDEPIIASKIIKSKSDGDVGNKRKISQFDFQKLRRPTWLRKKDRTISESFPLYSKQAHEDSFAKSEPGGESLEAKLDEYNNDELAKSVADENSDDEEDGNNAIDVTPAHLTLSRSQLKNIPVSRGSKLLSEIQWPQRTKFGRRTPKYTYKPSINIPHRKSLNPTEPEETNIESLIISDNTKNNSTDDIVKHPQNNEVIESEDAKLLLKTLDDEWNQGMSKLLRQVVQGPLTPPSTHKKESNTSNQLTDQDNSNSGYSIVVKDNVEAPRYDIQENSSPNLNDTTQIANDRNINSRQQVSPKKLSDNQETAKESQEMLTRAHHTDEKRSCSCSNSINEINSQEKGNKFLPTYILGQPITGLVEIEGLDDLRTRIEKAQKERLNQKSIQIVNADPPVPHVKAEVKMPSSRWEGRINNENSQEVVSSYHSDCPCSCQHDVVRAVKSKSETNKYDIMHNMLLWLKHYMPKEPIAHLLH